MDPAYGASLWASTLAYTGTLALLFCVLEPVRLLGMLLSAVLGRWRTDADDAARARARTERARQAWPEVSEESRAQLAARLQAAPHAVLDTLQGPVLHRQVVSAPG